MGDKASYKLERQNSGKSPMKATSEKPSFDKDEEFDQLLKDFKNYQVGSSKKEGGKSADD